MLPYLRVDCSFWFRLSIHDLRFRIPDYDLRFPTPPSNALNTDCEYPVRVVWVVFTHLSFLAAHITLNCGYLLSTWRRLSARSRIKREKLKAR